MAFEPIFPIEGNLLNDPELRFTPNGVAVANFRVGINDARPEQNNGKTDVPPLVAEVTVWREMAENATESLKTGSRITAKVRMTKLGAYIPRGGGEPVGTLKVEALEIGPSLRWAKAAVTKVAGGQNHGQGQQGGNQQNGNQQGGGWGGQQQGQQGGDPWSGGQHPGQQGNQQNGNQQGGWGSDQDWGNGGNTGNDPWGQ